MKENRIVVTYDPGEDGRDLLERMLGSSARLVFLQDVPETRRATELSAADVLLSWHPSSELRSGEWAEISGVRLIQLISAGADHVPFSDLPARVEISTNAGAYAEPMAEHVLAMTLALSKRLLAQHDKLSRGEFDQGSPNRTLRGTTCGVLGFGGIGHATARLMRAMGARIYALNRSGQSQEPAEFIGTLDDLEHVLRASDVVVVALPLNGATRGLIGARELEWMKADAILINVARGEIIDEEALYAHLVSHPRFFAGIDAWWVEPVRHGRFAMGHPFLDLPNVIGSPHNSAGGGAWRDQYLRRAVQNCRRAILGETPWNLIGSDERVL